MPTSDSYLRRKLGAEALPLAARVEMCQRALADSPWDVFSHGWANAFSAGEVVARAARARLGVEVVAVPCYGADFAERSHAASGEERHVCVGRPGHTAAVRRAPCGITTTTTGARPRPAEALRCASRYDSSSAWSSGRPDASAPFSQPRPPAAHTTNWVLPS